MTVKELYEWSIKNKCENYNLEIVDLEGKEYHVCEDMITTVRYKCLEYIDKVVISL